MAITRYAGDRFTIAAGETKPTGVLDGAVLIDTGNLTQHVKRTVAGTSQWSQIAGGGGGGSPGGANTQVQFNNAGAFGGDADLTFTDGNRLNVNKLGISGNIYDSNNSIGNNGMVLTNEGTTGVNWKAIEDVLSGVGGSGVANYVARWADEDTLTTGVLVDNGTNVGINVPSPNYPLEISSSGNATVRIEDTTNNSRLDLRAEDSAVLIRSTSNFPMRFDVNQTERMRIDTAGKVGIGTDIPRQKLQVGGTTIEDTAIKIDSAANANANKSWLINATQADALLRIGSENNPTSLVIKGSDGKVGIGTTNVGYKLDVVEVGGVASARIRSTNANVARLFLSNTVGTWRLYSAAASNSFRIFSDSLNDDTFVIDSNGKVGIGTASPASKLHVYGADPVLTIQDSESTVANASAILRIGESDTNANLNNNFALKFAGSASGGDLDISRYNNTSLAAQGVRIKHDGNVGIGTNSPQGKLDINTEVAEATHVYINGEVNQDKLLYFRHYANSEGAGNNAYVGYIGSNGIDNLLSLGHLNSSGTDVPIMHLTEAGKVGIGTTSADLKLHINNAGGSPNTRFSRGTSYIFDLKIDNIITNSAIDYIIEPNQPSSGILFRTHNSSNTNINALAINRDGNVGIGTLNPLQKLHVVGSTLISNNSYHYGYTSGGAQATLVGKKSNNYVTVGQLNANNVGTDIYGGTGNIYLYSGSVNRLIVSSDVNVQGATDLNINGPSRKLRFTSGTGTIRTTTSNNLILQTNSISAITIYPTQQVQFNAYGSGTFTGTATQRLGSRFQWKYN